MMKKDLTNSQLDRQNILNNNMALEEIRNTSNIQGVWFEDKVYFTKNMVAEFFEVDIRTIERCVSANLPELEKNGYEIIKGTRLKGFIEAASSFNAAGIDIGIISNKTTLLAIFEKRKYEVDDTFPKITKASFKDDHIPESITQITYTIDLDGLEYTVW